MTAVAWLLGLIIVGGFGYVTWRAYSQWVERQRAAEARMATFVQQAKTPAAPAAASVPSKDIAQQQLLFEAASKAGQAGEPVLAIQLYARLLSRYPQTALAAQARAAVDEQKHKLAKA